MFLSTFQPLCINCGGLTAFAHAICEDCALGLEQAPFRCKSCGYALSREADWCRHCEDKKIIDRYYSDYIYTGPLKALLLSIKFGWRFRGAGQLGELCRMDGIDVADYDCIVPIPSHPLRFFARYRHPVDIIAQACAEHSGLAKEDAMKRLKHTDYQARLSRSRRKLNVQGAFGLKKRIRGMKILIVDDILTTGATAMQAAKTLKRGGAAAVGLYTLMAGAPR
jgi:ComF family protein